MQPAPGGLVVERGGGSSLEPLCPDTLNSTEVICGSAEPQKTEEDVCFITE